MLATMTHGTPTQANLAAQIAEASLLRGNFTLRSGRQSKYYLDKYRFSTRPEILKPLASLFSARCREVEIRAGVKIKRLSGAELGGIPLVTATSMEMGLPCVFVRNQKKDYGTAKQAEGTVDAGDVMVLLEDVATTGGQALEAVAVLQGLGARVVAVIATIDRQEGARENIEKAGLIFDSLFTKKDLGIDE
jgi:orotate phosphoribosyltransferase